MVRNYKKESYCGYCGETTPESAYKPVYGNYGYIVAEREHHEYPRVYDDRGNLYDVQTLIPIKQLNRRGLDGTLFEEITEFPTLVRCRNCGRICRSGSYSKTKYNEEKEKTVHRIDKVGIDDVFGKPKVEPIDSKAEWVKKSKEYIHSDKPIGRPKGSTDNKEEIDHYVDLIKKTKNTVYEVTLEEVRPRYRSKVKRILEKEYEGKESSHVT